MRKLHVGGKVRTPGWEVIDATPGPHVDHVGNAKDLSRFETATFSDVYASHVLEHFDYRDEIFMTLVEWCRVLIPGVLSTSACPTWISWRGCLLHESNCQKATASWSCK